MRNQNQGWAEFVVETPSNQWLSAPPQFSVFDIVLKARNPHPSFCQQKYRVKDDLPGANVQCSDPVVAGNVCRIQLCQFNGGYQPNQMQKPIDSTPTADAPLNYYVNAQVSPAAGPAPMVLASAIPYPDAALPSSDEGKIVYDTIDTTQGGSLAGYEGKVGFDVNATSHDTLI